MTTELNAFAEFEHDFWEKSSQAYDSAFTEITRQTNVFLLEAVQLKQGMHFLDIACGPGYASGEALNRSAVTTGLDFSAAMVRLAAQKFPGCDFRVGDAQNLPFEDQSFDTAVCNFGIMHLPDPEKAFAEAFRVLKRNGRFAFAVWNNLDTAGALNMIINSIKTCGNFDIPLPEGPPFFKYSDSKTATTSLQNAGFDNVFSREITVRWQLNSASEMIRAFHDGGARIGGILRAQTPGALQKIENALAEKMKAYKDSVPVSVVMTGGQRLK